jgi:hypothetical protein
MANAMTLDEVMTKIVPRFPIGTWNITDDEDNRKLYEAEIQLEEKDERSLEIHVLKDDSKASYKIAVESTYKIDWSFLPGRQAGESGAPMDAPCRSSRTLADYSIKKKGENKKYFVAISKLISNIEKAEQAGPQDRPNSSSEAAKVRTLLGI